MHKFPDMNYQMVRNKLGQFGLEGSHHEQEIHTLSGGQKSRVVFVELGMQRCERLANHRTRRAAGEEASGRELQL